MNKSLNKLKHRFVVHEDLPKSLQSIITDRGEGFRYSDEMEYLRLVRREGLGNRELWEDGEFTTIHCLTPSGTVLTGIAVYTQEFDRYGNDITAIDIPKALEIAASRLEESIQVHFKPASSAFDDALDAMKLFGTGIISVDPVLFKK